MIVWWTIPDSYVAWEWRPAESTLVEGALVRDPDACCYLVPATTTSHRWPEPREPAGQALAEMTAYFAMEANIRPDGMAIIWIHRDAAVRWDRPTGRWLRHRVGSRHGHRCLYGGTDLAGMPVPRGPEDAATTALTLLGSEEPNGVP